MGQTLTVVDNGGTYNGTPYTAIATINGQSNLDGCTPTLDYRQFINCWIDLGAKAPVNVGSYDVTANLPTIIGSTDYAGASSQTVDFSITPAALTPTITVADAGGVYNATPYMAIATVNSGPSLEGVTPTLDYHQSINGFWTDLGANAPVNVGSYDVTANFAGSTDYTAASSTTVDFSITPATATVSVTPISGLVYNWNAQETVFYSVISVNGPFYFGDFTNTTVHTNAGTYTDTWTFTGPNYISQSGTVTDTIAKANPGIGAASGTVVYNGSPQNFYGSIWALVGLSNVVFNDTHTNVGTYTDSWTFTDTTGNYNNASGAMVDQTTPATVFSVGVQPYNTFYNAVSHTAIGAAIGVNGVMVTGLSLGGTTHTNVGTYTDVWTFSNPNYNTMSGVVKDTITSSKSKMVRETVQVPTTVKVKVTERVWNGKKWAIKVVTVTETKMIKKSEMVRVYYN